MNYSNWTPMHQTFYLASDIEVNSRQVDSAKCRQRVAIARSQFCRVANRGIEMSRRIRDTAFFRCDSLIMMSGRSARPPEGEDVKMPWGLIRPLHRPDADVRHLRGPWERQRLTTTGRRLLAGGAIPTADSGRRRHTNSEPRSGECLGAGLNLFRRAWCRVVSHGVFAPGRDERTGPGYGSVGDRRGSLRGRPQGMARRAPSSARLRSPSRTRRSNVSDLVKARAGDIRGCRPITRPE
jgi:hypothetical protein